MSDIRMLAYEKYLEGKGVQVSGSKCTKKKNNRKKQSTSRGGLLLIAECVLCIEE
jgi:hypothetical protein